MAYIGYLITLGCWEQAKNFGSDQMQKGAHAGSISLSCLRSITSPKELVNYLSTTRAASYHPIEPQEPLTPEMRSRRIRQGTELIAGKLRNQFEHAQNQAAQELDKAFQYLAAPANFQGHAQSERIADHEVGVCHFIGRRPTMEDEHLTTSFDLNVGGRAYPVQLFGIFDGHGGGEASIYVRDNLERKLHETLNEFCAGGLTDEAIWNALKITFVRLKGEFNERQSGTTATVAMILDGKLWTANVGDSRTILDNGIQLSEDAKPTDPRYRQGIENRGGVVRFNRVNGNLAVARAVGDHNVGAISARPKITVYPLSMIPRGSHLILTCDGIYDVSSTRQIAAAVRAHRNQSAAELAKNIVYSAYQADSGDNLSALVVKL
jgi:serine/threonine protein phosphatase PrpC